MHRAPSHEHPDSFGQSAALDEEQTPTHPPSAQPGAFRHSESDSCAQGVDVPVQVCAPLPALPLDPLVPPSLASPSPPQPPLAPALPPVTAASVASRGVVLSSEQPPEASNEVIAIAAPSFTKEV
jgi:hypothetical protein